MVIGQFLNNSSEGDGSEAVRRRRVRRFDRGRLKTETACVRTAHPLISGLKVLCRLGLV